MTSSYDNLDRPPLREATLRRSLVVPGAIWKHLTVVEQTGSTNADLCDAAGQGAKSGTILVAEVQTAGKGRLGRTWTAPPRSAVTLSVLLRPPAPLLTPLGWLPLVAAMAIDDALRRAEVPGTGVKWPNDVMVHGNKIAGVLSERVGDDGVVIGMGINVSMRPDEMPAPEATSLHILGESTDREVLVKTLLRCLASRYEQFLQGDRAGIRRDFLLRSVTVGQQVRAELPGGAAVEGLATDIDESGALRIDDGTSVQVVAAADVTHVRANT